MFELKFVKYNRM